MVKVTITKSNLSGKKFKAVFTGTRQKTVHFGAENYRDFTLVKNKQEALKARNSYRRRHVHDRINVYNTPGALSWWILWGNSQSIQQNIRDYKRRFQLD